ncbi:hypothetical protein [Motilimonas pumila]|uniref:Uncharacterized protein n=1 Tax=Motilimonas pumila TaxID=2303987 RepID=A0A418YHG3_9GAMM|nr:hypothetical protein [Motilimonas pumila]RJG49538.1 hypothetical protein D1Z90_06160 [Motilimonas pumila]
MKEVKYTGRRHNNIIDHKRQVKSVLGQKGVTSQHEQSLTELELSVLCCLGFYLLALVVYFYLSSRGFVGFYVYLP